MLKSNITLIFSYIYELVNILVQKSISKVGKKAIYHTKYLPYTSVLNIGFHSHYESLLLLHTGIAECLLFVPFVAYVLHKMATPTIIIHKKQSFYITHCF